VAWDRGALQRFVKRQRRQNSGEPAGEHGLAGARRSDHQQVVSACGRNFQGAPSERLPAQIAQVE
jgi:hypothetical protein